MTKATRSSEDVLFLYPRHGGICSRCKKICLRCSEICPRHGLKLENREFGWCFGVKSGPCVKLSYERFFERIVVGDFFSPVENGEFDFVKHAFVFLHQLGISICDYRWAVVECSAPESSEDQAVGAVVESGVENLAAAI